MGEGRKLGEAHRTSSNVADSRWPGAASKSASIGVMGRFTDWVEQAAESPSRADDRKRVSAAAVVAWLY